MISIKLATPIDQTLYRNLFNLLQHDLSQYNSEYKVLDEFGYFDYHSTDVYFENNPHVFPYLIYYKHNTKLQVIGLCVLSEIPYTKENTDYCIQEFFILNPYRHQGLGKETLKCLFNQYHGRYSLLVFKANQIARSFWLNIIREYGNNFTESEHNEQMLCYEFNIK